MIHISRSGAALGVFEMEKVRAGLQTGEFIATDLGWMEGMETWRPLAELDEFRVATPAPASLPEAMPLPVAASVSSAAVTVPKTEPLAIWSFVLSLVGLLCCAFVFSIPAVICGHLAQSKIRANPNLEGGGLALAGLVIGYLAIVLWVLYLVFFGGIAILQGLAGGNS